ncbi:MAG: zf-HC2 domain-containing protein [Actinobacteria bacterium]|nr:zf-HC2 domain-containing protein [Actinomycetota bacterium]
MNHADHAELRRSLGAYALGGLEPAERSQVEEHLEDCRACRDELASLAVLPGLLSRLSGEEASGDLLSVSDDHAERVVAAVARERRSHRRRLGVWRGVAAVAAAVALVLGAVVVQPWGGPDGTVYAVEVGDVQATATVEPREWGMQVDLHAGGLPDARGYTLWAVADDGHRAYVASWADVDRSEIALTGSCYMAASEVTHMEITDAEDRVLATLES